MLTTGVLVRVTATRGREPDAEEFLDAVLRLATREQHTETSLLLTFGGGQYALLDLFTDELARREHLAGAARQAIAYRTGDLFDGAPVTDLLDIVGYELPAVAARARLSHGTLLTFAAPETTGPGTAPPRIEVSAASDSAWLAVRRTTGEFAIVDLTNAPQGLEPARLPEVCLGGHEVRLVSTERFRLLGPDVPEVTAVPLPDADLSPKATHDATASQELTGGAARN